MRWCSPPPPLHLLLLLLLLGSSSLLLVQGSPGSPGSPGFNICAYNVQKFNLEKASDPRVLHTLTRIVARYDICLLQEVMDPDGKAINKLLAALNRYDDFSYKSLSSKTLGADKMQYVFIYRTDTVKVTAQHQYQKKQTFSREPFTVQFHSKKTAIKDFVLVPLQASSSQAVKEMDHLYDVFQEVSEKWNTTNVMFLGDFQAGCAHMTRSNKKKIRLFTNTKFSWLIGDKVDTTVPEETSCPYDRIVVHGKSFLKAVSPFSAKVFNYIKDFKLSRTKALAVSDHFPVEVRLKSSASFLQATPLLLLLAIIQYFL